MNQREGRQRGYFPPRLRRGGEGGGEAEVGKISPQSFWCGCAARTCPIADQNCQKRFWPKRLKNHSLWDRTYLWSPYEGVPTPRDRSIQRVKGSKMRFPNETEIMWSVSLLQSGKRKSVIIYPVRRLVQSRAISINLLVNLPVSIKIIHAHYLTQALCKLCHCNLNY